MLIQLKDVKTRLELIQYSLLLLGLATHNQFHMRDHTDCYIRLGFKMLQKLYCLINITPNVDQDIGINDNKTRHSGLPPLSCANLPYPCTAILHIISVTPNSNKRFINKSGFYFCFISSFFTVLQT